MRKPAIGVVCLVAVAGCQTLVGYEESTLAPVEEGTSGSGGAAGTGGEAFDGGAGQASSGSGGGSTGGEGGDGGDASADVEASTGGTGGDADADADASDGDAEAGLPDGGDEDAELDAIADVSADDVWDGSEGGIGGSGGEDGGVDASTGDADPDVSAGGSGGEGGSGGSAGTGGTGGAGDSGAGCTVGEAMCAGNLLKICQADGETWGETVCEGATPACDVINKECDACVAGSATCDGAVLKVCNADGSATTDTTCDSQGQCDSLNRRCLPAGPVAEIARTCGGATCARLTNGRVRCWGDNTHGAASGTTSYSSIQHYWSAVEVPGLEDVVQIAGGGNHFCAVVGSERKVKCWGANGSQQLGVTGYCPGVAEVPQLSGVLQVAAFHASDSSCGASGTTCALLEDGTVSCWGSANYGVLGDGTTVARASPGAVPGLSGIVQLSGSISGSLVCARPAQGAVQCWGNNLMQPTEVPLTTNAVNIETGVGLLYVTDSLGITAKHSLSGGTWTRTIADQASPPYAQMSAGSSSYFCAVRTDGRSTCGGQIFVMDELRQIELGDGVTSYCAVTTAGTVVCWGGNLKGQLGNGKPLNVLNPVAAQNVSGAVDLFVGGGSSVAMMQDGSAVGWGQSSALKLNNQVSGKALSDLGANNSFARPGCVWGASDTCAYVGSSSGLVHLNSSAQFQPGTRLTGATGSTFLDALGQSATSGAFDIGWREDGSVLVFAHGASSNQYGIFGNGTTSAAGGDLVTVPGLTNVGGFADRDTSSAHACIWHTDGSAKCWGQNGSGQVGNGTATPATSPAQVLFFGAGTVLVKQMCLGSNHSCAVTPAGLVYCWGDNGSGQLGSGDNVTYLRGYPVPGLSGVAGVACGTNYTCAWLEDGTARCWGLNTYGQLGDGTYTTRNFAGPDLGLTNVIKVRAGASHTCALHDNGAVSCWGRTYEGQVAPGYGSSFTDLQVVVGLE